MSNVTPCRLGKQQVPPSLDHEREREREREGESGKMDAAGSSEILVSSKVHGVTFQLTVAAITYPILDLGIQDFNKLKDM